MSDLAVRARGLTRRFGALTAVDRLDLEIERSRIFGFLGPNGSGKSTTIRMLCGLLRPSAGEAQVLGCRVPREAEKLRRKIGYMTQHFSLYDDLSVRENLEFLGAIYSLPARLRRERVDAQLAAYQLADRPDQRAGTLSGGERQRLALGAATLHEPELLFLDEPTSAVDPQSRRDFWEILFALSGAGTTILVSTHFMDEAERCHDLGILHRGALVAHGAPRELMHEIDAAVVEIDTEDTRRARHTLGELAAVQSVTQLGARLRALVDPALEDPVATLRDHLRAAGLAAEVRASGANLEDVFVASTRRSPAPGGTPR